jgi:hypothetical protein
MMLRHTVVKHPFPRGHPRDLLLFADEVAHADVLDFRELERSLASDRYAPELADMLGQVEAMCERRLPLDPPATRRFVAWKYGTVLRATPAFREWIPGWTSISFVTLECPVIRRVEYRALFAYAVRAVPADSPLRALWVGAGKGYVSDAGMKVARSAYRLVLTLVLCLGARYLQRSVAAMMDLRSEDEAEGRCARWPSG